MFSKKLTPEQRKAKLLDESQKLTTTQEEVDASICRADKGVTTTAHQRQCFIYKPCFALPDIVPGLSHQLNKDRLGEGKQSNYRQCLDRDNPAHYSLPFPYHIQSDEKMKHFTLIFDLHQSKNRDLTFDEVSTLAHEHHEQAIDLTITRETIIKALAGILPKKKAKYSYDILPFSIMQVEEKNNFPMDFDKQLYTKHPSENSKLIPWFQMRGVAGNTPSPVYADITAGVHNCHGTLLYTVDNDINSFNARRFLLIRDNTFQKYLNGLQRWTHDDAPDYEFVPISLPKVGETVKDFLQWLVIDQWFTVVAETKEWYAKSKLVDKYEFNECTVKVVRQSENEKAQKKEEEKPEKKILTLYSKDPSKSLSDNEEAFVLVPYQVLGTIFQKYRSIGHRERSLMDIDQLTLRLRPLHQPGTTGWERISPAQKKTMAQYKLKLEIAFERFYDDTDPYGKPEKPLPETEPETEPIHWREEGEPEDPKKPDDPKKKKKPEPKQKVNPLLFNQDGETHVPLNVDTPDPNPVSPRRLNTEVVEPNEGTQETVDNTTREDDCDKKLHDCDKKLLQINALVKQGNLIEIEAITRNAIQEQANKNSMELHGQYEEEKEGDDDD